MTKRHSRRTDEEWMNLIQECRTSGLTDKRWCQEHNIQPSNFYYHIPRKRVQKYEIKKGHSQYRNILKKRHRIISSLRWY